MSYLIGRPGVAGGGSAPPWDCGEPRCRACSESFGDRSAAIALRAQRRRAGRPRDGDDYCRAIHVRNRIVMPMSLVRRLAALWRAGVAPCRFQIVWASQRTASILSSWSPYLTEATLAEARALALSMQEAMKADLAAEWALVKGTPYPSAPISVQRDCFGEPDLEQAEAA